MKELAIGIDIGGTNTVIGIVDKSGNLYSEKKITTKGYGNFESYLNVIFLLIQNELSAIKETFRLSGIGIGAPNGNYYKGTIEHAANLEWKGILPIAEKFKKQFKVPIHITNDANAAALGEKIYGGAKNMKHFIVITIGTGLGSGIVINGNLLYGADGFAGEMGHTTAIVDGRLCGCGRKGCLETYVSATGIVRTYQELLSENQIIQKQVNNSEEIYRLALLGNASAIKAFDYTANILGKALADAVAYFSPEAFFITGGLAEAGDLLIKPTKTYMEENLLEIYKNKIMVLQSELQGSFSAILGASALVWNEY
jgi:glucokinase